MESFSSTDLNFSDKAISHFLTSLDSRGKGLGIKIGVRKAGCSGYEYFFDFVDSLETKSILFEKSGCKIFVDQESLNFFKRKPGRLRWDGLNKGIKFINPNAKAVCGCGESFTV